MAQLTSQQHCLPCSGHCRSPSQACRPRQAACAAAVREDPQPSGRREAFAAAAGAVLLACSSSRAAQAEEVKVEPITKKGALKPLENKAKSEAPAASPDGFHTLYGKAGPPTSYGGYGGNAREAAKYSFEVPNGWKNETVGKVEKGMQGIDTRVTNPKGKAQQAFVVTFGRAGEDNKKFKLGDADLTLQGFAGADYDLQDALTTATDKKSYVREVDGQAFYTYEVAGTDINYFATITLNEGKVYALFVKSPARMYKGNEDKLRTMMETFRILS